MENLSIIILYSIGAIVGLFILFMLGYLVYDKLIDEPRLKRDLNQIRENFKAEDSARKLAENRLTLSLKSLCEQLNIPLTYHDELGTAAGQILYHSNGLGQLLLDNSKIMILNKYKDDPWVLAHELGHYMSIKHGDQTEESADAQGLILCKSILTQDEQTSLEIALRCHLGNTINANCP